MKVNEERIKVRKATEASVGTTSCGIPVKEVYGPEDIDHIDRQQDIGEPGRYPYTRGIHKNMYRGKLWQKSVFTGEHTVEETNARYKLLISRGETGLFLFADMPSAYGIDADHPLARGYAGLSSTPLYTLDDWRHIFEGIDLSTITLASNQVGPVCVASYASFVAYAREIGYDLLKLRASFSNEPLHAIDSCGGFQHIFPVELSRKLPAHIMEFSVRNTPKFHTLVPNGYDVHEKGGNAVHEVALTFAYTLVHIEEAMKRGLSIDEVGPRICFAMSTDMDLFEEIAKYRALRKVWAKIMKERYGATNPLAMAPLITSHTAGSSLTTQQPVNNIVRTTLEALALVLGGAQSMHPCGYDEPFCILSEEAATTALNIQHIIAHEARVGITADPLGGSYFIESLTDEMEKRIFEYLKKIEEVGGIIAAIDKGWIRAELEAEALKEHREIEDGSRIIVGVNEFVIAKDDEVPIKRYRTKGSEDSADKLEAKMRHFKENRDNKKVRQALGDLRSQADNSEKENILPSVIEAVKADCTVGEIMGVIREAWGYSYDPFNMVSNPFPV